MRSAGTFPTPFESLRTISGGSDGTYVIGAMFTAAYSEKAERLAASCKKFGLKFVIHEVPTVHRSISGRGTHDLAYTKPNFIRHLLASHKRPVLYLDADCEFVSHPKLIDHLVSSGCDFAIYNWFADECHWERYIPIELALEPNQPPIKNRFYRIGGSTPWFTKKQLGCTGIVQFYGNSIAARALLSKWHRTIEIFPDCADDASLNFVFNNLTKRSWLTWLLKVRWLPKSYARQPWWIFAEPIINHPDYPGSNDGRALGAPVFEKIRDSGGRQVAYTSLMERRNPVLPFPPDSIIDTKQHMVCKLVDGQLVPIAPLDQNFWL